MSEWEVIGVALIILFGYRLGLVRGRREGMVSGWTLREEQYTEDMATPFIESQRENARLQ